MYGTELYLDKENDVIRFDSKMPVFERICVFNFCEIKDDIRLNLITRNGVYCFFLVESGEADLTVNKFTKRIKAGELVASIPGETWEWDSVEGLNGKIVMFEADFLLAVLKGGFSLEPVSSLNNDKHYPFIPLSEKIYSKLKYLMCEMEECLDEKPVFYDLLRNQLWQFVFLSEKQYIANGNEGRESLSLNHLPTFVNLVNRFFRSHKNTSFYAERMHITPNYLNKIVKQATGISAREYILNRVMSEAKLLLRITRININEVCYELGFEDPNYFIRLFKKYEGVSPGEYQKRGTL